MQSHRLLFERREASRFADVLADVDHHFLIRLLAGDLVVDTVTTDDLASGLSDAAHFLFQDATSEARPSPPERPAPPEGIDYAVDRVTLGVYRLVLRARGKMLCERLYPNAVDAHLYGRQLVEQLRGWTLVDEARAVEGRPVVPLITRANKTHRAWIVRITPGSGGGMMGLALHLYEGPNLIFGKFRLFPAAVEEGNLFVSAEGAVTDVVAEPVPAVPETPRYGAAVVVAGRAAARGPEPSGAAVLEAAETGYEFKKANIHTVVLQVPNVLPPGYKVQVYVDGTGITEVFKDQNSGGYLFTLMQAVERARDLCEKLQGWSTSG